MYFLQSRFINGCQSHKFVGFTKRFIFFSQFVRHLSDSHLIYSVIITDINILRLYTFQCLSLFYKVRYFFLHKPRSNTDGFRCSSVAILLLMNTISARMYELSRPEREAGSFQTVSQCECLFCGNEPIPSPFQRCFAIKVGFRWLEKTFHKKYSCVHDDDDEIMH